MEGRSPTQLAVARFRKDKLSMTAFFICVFYVVGGIAAPILVKLGVLDAENFNQDLLDVALGGIPKGSLGGISWSHPLGVEPGIGRDLLSRIALGTTYSLAIALTACVLTIVIGAVLGIVAGFSGGFSTRSSAGSST